jgi:hypothetical protein
MNIITLNPSNVDYISDFMTNYVFDAMSKDKMLSQFASLPEFGQLLGQSISKYFQNAVSQNQTIDLNKLSSLNQNFDDLKSDTNEIDESEDIVNSYADNLDEDVFLDREAFSKKNIRTAQWYVNVARYLAPIVRKKLGPLLATVSYVGPLLSGFFEWIMDQVEKIIEVLENAIIEKFDPEFWKEVVLSYNAYDAINESKKSEMYSTEAYNQLLENNKVRGYGGQLHSQGAYEVLGPDFKKQFSDQVIQNPDLVNSRFKDDPNIGPSVKRNFQQVIASKNTKFVKVAQQEMSAASQQKLDELQSVLPNWNINTVLREVYAVYQSPDIPQDEKQQAVDTTISKYLRAAQPLRNYLKENNFANPDTAK